MSELISAVKNLQSARASKLEFSPEAIETTRVQKGRKIKGKRSDPSFEQVTAYIRKETYLSTKMALLQAGNGQDFSELLEELLGEFLRTQKSGYARTHET